MTDSTEQDTEQDASPDVSEDSTRAEIDGYARDVYGLDTTGAANKQAALDMIDKAQVEEDRDPADDGTVGSMDPDQSLPASLRLTMFNERPSDSETIRVNGQDVENEQATFRSATGHNYDEEKSA